MYSYNNIIDKAAPAGVSELDATMAAVLTSSAAGGRGGVESRAMTVERFQAVGVAQPVDAVLAHNLLTHRECVELIRLSEEKGGFSFWAAGAAPVATAGESSSVAADDEARLPGEHAPSSSQHVSQSAVPTGMKNEEQARAFRSAYTVEGLFPLLAAELWKRICEYVPLTAKHYSPDMPDADSLFERDIEGTWVPHSLSDNMLFARYLDGGHFAPHVDGSTIVDLNTRSLYTVLIYLNDCLGGGETHIVVGDQCEVLTKDEATGKVCGNGRNCVGSIVPKEGSAAVFAYHVLHEGGSVHPGHKKYIIRADVLYKRTPPILTEPKDLEAFELYQRARVMEANGLVDDALRLFQLARRKSPGLAELYQL